MWIPISISVDFLESCASLCDPAKHMIDAMALINSLFVLFVCK